MLKNHDYVQRMMSEKHEGPNTAPCPNILWLHCVLHVYYSDDAGEDCSLDMYGGDPAVSCTPGSGDSEQEVPLGSHLCQEASMYTAEKHRGS